MTKIVQEMTRLWEVNNSPALYFHFQFAHAWLPVNTRSWRGPCKHNHLGKVLMLTLALVQIYWLSSANVVTTESLHLLMQGQMQTCLMCKKFGMDLLSSLLTVSITEYSNNNIHPCTMITMIICLKIFRWYGDFPCHHNFCEGSTCTCIKCS